MKQIKKRLYFGLAILGLLVPLQVTAAGRDSVTLSPDDSGAAVSLGMSNATEEEITAVAISLDVEAENRDLITVGFEFSQELGGVETGYIYNEETGRLDIYAASTRTLFTDETLNLGHVSVGTSDASRVVAVEISYHEDSFQTANGSYGSKTPVVESNSGPVSIQLGYVPEPPNTGDNQGGDSGDNMDDGLYDDETRFTNNPSDAQNIPTSIIMGDGKNKGLADLSKGNSARKVPLAGSNKGKEITYDGKVTVIDPEDGPSSILITKEDGKDAAVEGSDAAAEEEKEVGNNVEEIMLDRANGGVIDNSRNGGGSSIPMVCVVLVVLAVAGGGVYFYIIKKKGTEGEGKQE